MDSFLNAFFMNNLSEKDKYVHYYYMNPAENLPMSEYELKSLYFNDFRKTNRQTKNGLDCIGEFAEILKQTYNAGESCLDNLKGFYENILPINNRKRLELLKFNLLFGTDFLICLLYTSW